MTNRTAKLLHGLITLTPSERDEVVNGLSDFIRGNSEKKKTLSDGFERKAGFDLGPMGSDSCPWCGHKQ